EGEVSMHSGDSVRVHAAILAACTRRARRGGSEAHDVGGAVDQRVDLRATQLHAVEADVAVDVHPAHVDADRALFAELEVDAGVQRQAEGGVKLELRTRKRAAGVVAEKGGVVQAHAQQRRDRALAVEVVLQADGRRQVLGAAHAAEAVDADVVLERQCGQHFQAQVVAHEVLDGDGRARAGADVQRQGAGGKLAVVGIRVDLVRADGDGPVAGGLCEGGRGGEGAGDGKGEQRKGEGEDVAGHRGTCSLWRMPPWSAVPYGAALIVVKSGAGPVRAC